MQKRSVLQSSASAIMITAFMAAAGTASAQGTTGAGATPATTAQPDVILVSGIRASLADALDEKRRSDNIVEVIKSEDIGKLPDQNLAEVLENITGVQIDRSAGVGTAVQIRGTGANRIEINGVSTVGAGNGRSGISFEDLPASLISAVEVTKVSEARTIEGSVGGTINLRTIRPLDLSKTLIAFRVQGEHSDLSDTISPRISGTFGKNWDTNAGEIGIVLSGSYAELDVTQFSPRADRDRVVLPTSGFASAEAFPFLRIQFFDQPLTNQEFETVNFNGSFEWKPADNFRFYMDATLNDQQRIQQSSRVQISGTTANGVINNTDNTSFETVNFGTVDGPNGPLVLGEAQAVLTGIVGVGRNVNGPIDPNLRTGTNTSSRVTDSSVLASGVEWEIGRLSVLAEVSRSESNTTNPNLSTDLDFINPRGPQIALGQSSDNGVAVEFDLRGSLQFGLAQGLAGTPTVAELLDPANYLLRTVNQGASTNDNAETAFRLDLSYDTSDALPLFSSIDLGYRHNVSTAVNRDINLTNNFTGSGSPDFFRPSLDLLGNLAVAGQGNFGDADGRELFFGDFLVIDPSVSVNNPGQVINAINEAIAFQNRANGVSLNLLGQPTEALTNFFDIEEKTNALYIQGNYDLDLAGMPLRGNIGLRWLQTEISSVGNNVINGVVDSLILENSEYDFFLPRFSLVAEPLQDVLVRAGISRDIRRPNFDALSTSVAFGGNPATVVNIGNPALEPESVWSYDLSAEYYFSDSGFFSVGVFHKSRTNLFTQVVESPVEVNGPLGIERDITAPCEGGGIFNPLVVDRNVFSSVRDGTNGICVPRGSFFNADGTTTQTGIEIALQYDLSGFEDSLGFASGFGVIANFTYQEEGGNISNFFDGNGGSNSLNLLLGRTDTNTQIVDDVVVPVTPDDDLSDDVIFERVRLEELSNFAYNLTGYYDKYGINLRVRYTWRSDFLLPNSTQRFGLPRILEARGQLNSSLSYALTDNVTVGVDGINLLRGERNEFCVNDGALLCEQGFTDRRIVGGVSFKF